MKYVIVNSNYSNDKKKDVMAKVIGIEHFDNKPLKNEVIVMKDRRAFVVIETLHKSILAYDNLKMDEDYPTTHLVVKEVEMN